MNIEATIVLNQIENNPLPAFQQNSVQWEQFETFKKRLSEEKQHFKERPSPKKQESYQGLEKIKQLNPLPNLINTQNNDFDRSHQLRLENQELRDKLSKLQMEMNEQGYQREQDNSRLTQEAQAKYQQQLRMMREKYEQENQELIERLNNFTDELEEIKKNYKEKNMKLYNLVLHLEKEKQELIEQNINQLDSRGINDRSIHLTSQIKEQQIIITQLESKNIKLQQEKVHSEQQYQTLIKSLNDQRLKQSSSLETIQPEESQKFHFKQRYTQMEGKPPLGERVLENNPSTASLTQGSKASKKSIIKEQITFSPQMRRKNRKDETPRKSLKHLMTDESVITNYQQTSARKSSDRKSIDRMSIKNNSEIMSVQQSQRRNESNSLALSAVSQQFQKTPEKKVNTIRSAKKKNLDKQSSERQFSGISSAKKQTTQNKDQSAQVKTKIKNKNESKRIPIYSKKNNL